MAPGDSSASPGVRRGAPPCAPAVLLLLLALAASLLGGACLAGPGSSEASAEAGVAAPAWAPATLATAASLRDAALRGTGAYDVVRSLTVEVGPRSAGSPGDAAAVAWGLAKLAELGLANVHAEKVAGVPHWERGTNAGRIVAPWPQPVVLTALGGSVATPGGGIEAEVVGAGSLEELGKLDPARVRGKIVFIDGPMERTRDASGYGRAVEARGKGPSAAAKLGAVALVIRSVGTDHDRAPHTGSLRYAEGVPQIPAAALSAPDADLLAAELRSGRPVRFRLVLATRRLADAESANVVGEVPGREAPGEVVLLGAHLDSWDLGTGAIDDGAGVAIVAETARRIAALPAAERPRRTVRVVLFANEEFGLSGAKAYAAAHAAELPRHVLAAESDLGSGRVWRLRSRVAPAALPAFDRLAALLAPLGVERGDNQAGGGADLSPIPTVPVASLDQDATRYFDVHHTANDTLDEIDAKDLDQNVAAWLALTYAVADSDLTFGPAPAPPKNE